MCERIKKTYTELKFFCLSNSSDVRSFFLSFSFLFPWMKYGDQPGSQFILRIANGEPVMDGVLIHDCRIRASVLSVNAPCLTAEYLSVACHSNLVKRLVTLSSGR